MKDFILDKNPNINEANVTLDGVHYNLRMIHGNGCYLSVFERGILTDEIALTKRDMRAIHLLLSTN